VECTTPPPRSRTAGTPTSSPKCSAVHGVVADPEHSRAVIGAQMWREEEMVQQYNFVLVSVSGQCLPQTTSACPPPPPWLSGSGVHRLAGPSKTTFQDCLSRLCSVRVNQTVRLLHRLLGAQGLLSASPTAALVWHNVLWHGDRHNVAHGRVQGGRLRSALPPEQKGRSQEKRAGAPGLQKCHPPHDVLTRPVAALILY
jgi:hypothetical protein